MFKKIIRTLTLILFSSPLILAHAVQVDIEGGGHSLTMISIKQPLGFSRVNNAHDDSPTGILIRDSKKNIDFKISAYSPLSSVVGEDNPEPFNSEVLHDEVINDVTRPGQLIRRIKIVFNNKILTSSDSPLPKGKGDYEIYIIDENDNIISDAAQVTSRNSIPVEFTGGNGSPLSMYIESDVHFSGFDTANFHDKNSPYVKNNGLFLAFTNSNFKPPKLNKAAIISPLIPYNQDGHVIRRPDHARLYTRDHTIFIDAVKLFSYNPIYKRTDIKELGIFPSVTQTLKRTFSPFFGDQYLFADKFNPPAPKSGWYDLSLHIGTMQFHRGYYNGYLPGDLSLLSDKPRFNKAPVDKEIVDLITRVNTRDNNRTFDPKALTASEFGQERFFIVSSFDADGRIKLKPIEPKNYKDKHPEFTLSLNRIADGDVVWYGSSVRWFSAGKDNRLIVRDGYLGWHDPNGKYAFLKLHDGSLATGDTAPKVGTVFVFNWAKESE
ncbi:MAG: hypothetical protein ACPGUD_08550 [Parashewanella sp.]